MNEQQNQEVSTLKTSRFFTLVLFVAMAGAIVYLYARENSTPKEENEVASVKAELENARELIVQLKEAELHRKRDQQVAQSRLTASRLSLEQAANALEELDDAVKAWTKTTESLKTSPQGMRLAAAPTALSQFEALLQVERPAPTLVDSLQARLKPLEQLVATAEKAEKEDLVSFDPGPTFTAELDSIKADAEPALKIYREHNERLETILAAIPEKAPEDARTLDIALEERKEKRFQEQNRLTTEEVEKVHEENAKKLAAEEAKAERRRGDIEREKLKKKNEIEELKEKAKIAGLEKDYGELKDAIEEALRRKELERDFEKALPEIRSLLHPFITDGRTQPEQGLFRLTTSVGPVSLGALRSEAVLKPTIDHQRRLWGMTASGRNDRDLGGFPSYIGNNMDWNAKQPTVQKAQELLIKYGDLMVEKEMLAP